MANLTIDNVKKTFGRTPILHGVSIEIEDGAFVILVGPSGCGKSTLLRMIAGLEEITDGEISIGSRVVNGVPPKERDIAMVFQSYALYPHMTVNQNMAFSLKLKSAGNEEITSKVGRAAGILGLRELLERYPKELSGGQRQRVAMGRAIVRDPAVFLFDEPLSNLDAKLRVQMRGEIKSLHQRLGTTTVYVTHDQIEAMTMADQIVVMNSGRIEQMGAPLDLYDRPANIFVAGFIGSPAMNFLDGTVRENGFETAQGLVLPLAGNARARVGTPAVYGVRPEHLALDPDGLPFAVELVEPTGSETQVQGRLADQPVSGVFRERIRTKPGETLRVSPQPGAVHLFDAKVEPAVELRRATIGRHCERGDTPSAMRHG